jgi:hypothetical protein
MPVTQERGYPVGSRLVLSSGHPVEFERLPYGQCQCQAQMFAALGHIKIQAV